MLGYLIVGAICLAVGAVGGGAIVWTRRPSIQDILNSTELDEKFVSALSKIFNKDNPNA